jgi:hypothetical protein
MSFDSDHLALLITTIGSLGVAAFSLVDALKTLPDGGISHVGFPSIEQALRPLCGGQGRGSTDSSLKRLFDTLHGNWINGMALADQKAIAKSMLKLRLNADTAELYAQATGVSSAVLRSVGDKMSLGSKLDDAEMNVLGRFDLGLSAILDDAYQHADQRYRNAAKLAATAFALLLAVFGGLSLASNAGSYFSQGEFWPYFIAGLLATPLAPVSKDLASALSAGVKLAQAVRR